MPSRRKTAKGREDQGPGGPKGAPDAELRAWDEERIIRAARVRYPSGFERGSEEELVAVGTVLLELGGDPNRLLLDAAVAALRARYGSTRGRKPDYSANRRQELGVRMVRVVAEMTEAAEGTRALPEADRLEEMAVAAAGELARQFANSHEDEFGEPASDETKRYWWVRSLDAAREWIAAHPAIARAMLDRPRTKRGGHEEAAMELLEVLGPLDSVEVPFLLDQFRSARISVERRSREDRRKAYLERAALKIE